MARPFDSWLDQQRPASPLLDSSLLLPSSSDSQLSGAGDAPSAHPSLLAGTSAVTGRPQVGAPFQIAARPLCYSSRLSCNAAWSPIRGAATSAAVISAAAWYLPQPSARGGSAKWNAHPIDCQTSVQPVLHPFPQSLQPGLEPALSTDLSLTLKDGGLQMCEDCHVGLQVPWSVPSEQLSGSERPRQVSGANGTSSRRAESGAGLAGSGLPSREDSDPAAPEELAEPRQPWQSEAPAPLEARAATDRWPGAQPGSQSSSSWTATETRAQDEVPDRSSQSRQAPAAASKAASAGPGAPGRSESEEAGTPHRPSSNGSQAQQAPDHDGDGDQAGASPSAAVLGPTAGPAVDAPEVDLESFECLLSAGKELFRQVHTL